MGINGSFCTFVGWNEIFKSKFEIFQLFMSINHILAQATAEAVKNLYGLEVTADSITISATKKQFEGNV